MPRPRPIARWPFGSHKPTSQVAPARAEADAGPKGHAVWLDPTGPAPLQKMIGTARRKHFHCSQFASLPAPGRACMRSRERETGLPYLTGVMLMHEALHELST